MTSHEKDLRRAGKPCIYAFSFSILNFLACLNKSPYVFPFFSFFFFFFCSVPFKLCTVEIQTNSNVTYRIYDYGRNRPLHISQALAVTNFNPVNVRAENYQHPYV